MIKDYKIINYLMNNHVEYYKKHSILIQSQSDQQFR